MNWFNNLKISSKINLISGSIIIITFMIFNPTIKLTILPNKVAMPPTRSVLLIKKSLGLKNLIFRYFHFASCIISAILTSEGQVISHLLQFVQYLREASTSSGFLILSLSASGPDCFGPGKR